MFTFKYIEMKNRIAVLLFFTTSFLCAQNPILPDFHADPSVHYWDGKYWMFPSTDEVGNRDWSQMKRWNLFSSTDLVNWKDEGEIFDLSKGDISWAKKYAFAPDAVKWKGKYYFFFPADKKIGVAVSEHATGPFKDALGKPLIEFKEVKRVATFDPCIFIDEDHTPYLYYGGGDGCAMVKLKDNLIERAGELKKLDLPYYGEGIWVHRYNGLYYFTYPRHIKREGKVEQFLVHSTAPTPTGPFTYRGKILDNKSKNVHHSVVNVKDKWYLFYHVQGPSGYERRVCAEYLKYDSEGNIKPIKMTKKGIKPLK